MTKNKYSKLASNTILFAIASFGPKFFTFAITGVMTRVLGPEGFGGYDKIYSLCNLILPIVYITIYEAVIRYGSDKDIEKSDVFTTSILVLLTGYAAFMLLLPVLRLNSTIANYPIYIYTFVLASAMRTILSNFTRALGKVKLFAIDGIITSVITMGLNLLFLLVFKLGPISSILATICGDAFSSLFLIIAIKAWRYFKIKGLDKSVSKQMIKYSLLMMPTAVFWWIINASNREIIDRYAGGLAAVGAYGPASRIASVITMVSAVFIQAWQMSAFTEQNEKERESFFSKIFNGYSSLIFLAVSVIIIVVRPLMRLFAGADYPDSWQYVPFILFGIGLSCLVTFLGTIYNTAKRNGMVMITSFIGAALNLALNFILIPRIGIQGAAIATFSGYFVVFVIRFIDSRKYINLFTNPFVLWGSIGLIVVQILLSLSQIKYGVALQVVAFLALLLLNINNIGYLVQEIFRMRKKGNVNT